MDGESLPAKQNIFRFLSINMLVTRASFRIRGQHTDEYVSELKRNDKRRTDEHRSLKWNTLKSVWREEKSRTLILIGHCVRAKEKFFIFSSSFRMEEMIGNGMSSTGFENSTKPNRTNQIKKSSFSFVLLLRRSRRVTFSARPLVTHAKPISIASMRTVFFDQNS